MNRRACFSALLLAAIPLWPAAAQDGGAGAPFPHIRIDLEARTIELDGRVPIVADDPQAPVVYLELIACIPNTKEHEALVVTPAKPSHVHAALLMLGLEPGSPGSFSWEGETLIAHDPEGPAVSVELIYTGDDGEQVAALASEWVKNFDTGERLPDRDWVFAGSQMRDRGRGEMYDADGTGTLIGLTTFGAEVLAWPETISPDSGVEEPVWIADPKRVPPVDTPVTIRLAPVE